ncbi:MAG: hypothetical protein CMM49_07040 [Rhodospirillaceae bacterium]|nr:hypothetical protein [Rhodospirillaceae bacterium]
MILYNHKKKILIIIIIFSLFFIGDRFLSLVISSLINFSSNQQAMLHSKKLEGNIIIIGNSRSYRSFDINFLEKKFNNRSVINLSNVGNPTIVSEVNLKNFNNLVGKPDIVIMEFSNLFNDEQAILNFRPFQGKNLYIDELINLYFPKYFLFGEIFHLFRFNSSHTILLLYKIINKSLNNKLYGNTKFAIESVIEKNYKTKSFRHSRIFEDNLNSFKNIISFCKKYNIDLKIVISPIFKNDFKNQKHKKIFLDLFPYINVFDFSEIDSLTKNDFYDINHLNSDGVDKFMQELENSTFFN